MIENETNETNETNEPEESGPVSVVPEEVAEDPRDAQIAKLKEQLLRTAADYDNFRKRARRDVEDAGKRSKEQTLLEILPLIDNLERALGAATTATDIEAVTNGVRMVLRSFGDVAGRLGLERVEAVGTPFDPNVHDAVQQIETEEHPAGTVVAEVTSGYKVGDKLLRAALVVVARPPSAD